MNGAAGSGRRTEPDGELVRTVQSMLHKRCAAAGLDVVHPFRLASFNDAVAAIERLPDFGRTDALGVLIGNTRALWPPFVEACRADPVLASDPHPLERYAVTVVRAVAAELPVRWRVRWAHDAPPRRPPMQRLAHRAGLAHLAPCGLNVHPTYGPWIAFRAVLVIDVSGPSGPAVEPANACPNCATECLPAFERAMDALRDQPDAAAFGLNDTWRLWLAVRDACPIGRSYRYGDDQIAYHYRGDRAGFA